MVGDDKYCAPSQSLSRPESIDVCSFPFLLHRLGLKNWPYLVHGRWYRDEQLGTLDIFSHHLRYLINDSCHWLNGEIRLRSLSTYQVILNEKLLRKWRSDSASVSWLRSSQVDRHAIQEYQRRPAGLASKDAWRPRDRICWLSLYRGKGSWHSTQRSLPQELVWIGTIAAILEPIGEAKLPV